MTRSLEARFVRADPVTKALDIQIEALAARQTTVLIFGESGVGKERVAREIHNRSRRASGPFVAVDCSSFSGALIESQLFGHIRGAFTGADYDHSGYIRAADGGTLFLDEVGDMPPTLQTRLLRVLQERCVTPVGHTRPIPVDVRIVAATHQNLPGLIRGGKFREDLFYRLSAYRLIVPPLRERISDIVPLANHFLDLQAQVYEEPRRLLSGTAGRWLESQPWRGNIRELANAIEFALVSHDRMELMPEDFPEPLLPDEVGIDVLDLADGMTAAPPRSGQVMTLREAEWRAVAAALRTTAGDKTRAARLLGISRSRLYSILARQTRTA
ncbi:MAG: sigma-54-dependent Fis family transcriptional regulator [Phycisphaerae bacterium]|nr:sigma-54-dependent Fis family transcriptional regulator [Phycisphaerae bacterium]